MSPRPRKASDEDIFGATMRVMTRCGPRELTLAMIAGEAGLTASALVQRFGSKRALLLGMGALNAGWPHEARNHFQRLLSDRATPTGIAERARMMVAMLDEAERAKGAPGAAEKPGSPPKAEAGGGKARPEPGKAK